METTCSYEGHTRAPELCAHLSSYGFDLGNGFILCNCSVDMLALR